MMEAKGKVGPQVEVLRGGAETRTAFMLLGRRAIEEVESVGSEAEPALGRRRPRARITVSVLRNILVTPSSGKVDGSAEKSQADAAAQSADDDKFLQSKTVRLDSMGIRKIENLEVLEELTHLHLQNNLIERIEELDFLRKLQWLDLSRCKINTVTGIAHLRELQHLDLSCNNIAVIDGDLKSAFPRISLRVLNMYGNPIALTENYRNSFTKAFPKLLAFDGTCLAAKPEDAPIAPGEEIYGCDGEGCNARVIFGPRFMRCRETDGAEEDYCISCAYSAVNSFKIAQGGKLEGHGFELQTNAKTGTAGSKNEPHTGGSSSFEKYERVLGASARAARLSMRNTREEIIMKARARRRSTAVKAKARMNGLGRKADDVASKSSADAKRK
eukprot:g3902.t1